MSVNPLWDFSLEFYERPGVADACLLLQDEAGLDVNLVLFCCWSALQGPGLLTADELRQVSDLAAPWQRDVVQPLRAARRRANALGGPGLFATSFRRDIAATELSAERVEQWLIYDFISERGQGGAGDDALPVACRNLANYAGLAGVGLEAVRPSMVTLLAAAWPAINAGSLREALDQQITGA